MKQRKYIQDLIVEAWSDTIAIDYCRQRINSERSLQASFWSQINDRLPINRRLFIEPPMKVTKRNDVKKLFPDLVVCNTREVIAVIEIKYLPRAQPKYAKDINSLAYISKNRNAISIANHRFLGPQKDGTNYRLSKHILFIWAGIHAKEKVVVNELYSANHKSLTGCFMELHAETRDYSEPDIYSRY